MKKIILLLCILIFTGGLKANLIVGSTSGSTVLTCSTPSLTYFASSAYFNVTILWTNGTTTLTGQSVTITMPGNYTVTSTDTLNVVVGTAYFTVASNTTPPNSSVSPASQTIACNTALGSGVSSSFSGSATHTFVSPYGTSVVGTGSVSYAPLGPGTYTHILTDNSNGCTSTSTFTIVSNQFFPTFSVVSPQNYTLGCGSKSVATVNIVNGSTSPPGGPVTYTFMPLSETNPAPGGTLSTVSAYTVSSPGLYYVVVRDNTSFCTTQIPVTILQNTTSPNVSAVTPTQVLNCNVGQVVVQGSSSSTNTSFSWTTPNGTVYGPSVTASANANVTQTLTGTFTFVVTDVNNHCTSSTVIPVYQNLFPPNAVVGTGGNYTLSCTTPTIVLTNQSYSGIPPSSGYPVSLPVAAIAWQAPVQPSLSLSTTYTASTSGTYTMMVKDLNNGCTAQATALIFGDCNLVGLAKNSLSKIALSIYPNPAHDLITLTIEENQEAYTVEIFNALGAVILKQEVRSSKTQMNVGALSHGLYTVRITQNNGLKKTAKFIKD